MTTTTRQDRNTRTFLVTKRSSSSTFERLSSMVAGVSLSLAFALVGAILSMAVNT